MTKRQLGILFIGLGVLVILGMFGMDLFRAGQYQGIGPAQKQAILVAGVIILAGITLLPFGDKPA